MAPGSSDLPGVRTELDSWTFAADYGEQLLKEHFSLLSLDGCGFGDRSLAIGAAGAVLHYLRDTQRAALEHLERPVWFERSDSMILDSVTVRNLELVEPMFAGEAASRLWSMSLTRPARHGRTSAPPPSAAAGNS